VGRSDALTISRVPSISDAIGAHSYIGVPKVSNAKPAISLLQVIPGTPEQAVFSVSDPVAGIYGIQTIAPAIPRRSVRQHHPHRKRVILAKSSADKI
jgi:hypothetical protein